MKKCMKCGVTYKNDNTFCAFDGERLVLVTEEPSVPMPAQNQQLQQPVAPASVTAAESVQSAEPAPVVEAAPVSEAPTCVESAPAPVEAEPAYVEAAPAPIEVEPAPASAPTPVQNEQPQPVAPVPTPVQNQQTPKQANKEQDSAAGPYNYGMTVIEKAVVGVLIGIIALALVLGILFITGVFGGK